MDRSTANRPFCFPTTDHVTIPLSFSLKRLRARMKMPTFERKYSPGYLQMICVGKTKLTSEKGLFRFDIKRPRSSST